MAVDVIRSKGRQRRGPRKVYEFGLEFYRADEPEVHEFKAYPVLDAGSLNYTLSATRKPERAIEGIVRTIRKMLADDDGTPLAYKPRRYEPNAPTLDDEAEHDLEHEDADPPGDQERERVHAEDATMLDLDELEDEDTLYVGPTGEPVSADAVREALKIENGSSRRRFAYLMDDDEELTLEADQLQTAYQRLVGKAADRPTRR